MKGKTIRRVGQCLAMSGAVLVMCAAVSGQDGTSTTSDKQGTTPAESATVQPAPRFPQSVEPLPSGQTEHLRAVVIDVERNAMWRPSDKVAWKPAKVNDWLDPGAQVRTGFRSSITLRVGKNGTILLERFSRMDLPLILQDGAVLRTCVAVRRGRAHFKVDVVGLTNDFEVLTPTTTLAVRGTGFAVTWGGLEGVAIDALAANVIHAIEVRYLLTNASYYLSGAGATRENLPDPVEVALVETVIPQIPGGLIEDEFLDELQNLRLVDYSRIGMDRTLAFVSGFALPTPQPTPMDDEPEMEEPMDPMNPPCFTCQKER